MGTGRSELVNKEYTLAAMSTSRFPCPCCGYQTFPEAPGSQLICPVCFWEDDIMQLRWPLMQGGANSSNLVDSQKNYQRLGAREARLVTKVRAPLEPEGREELWRPVNLKLDNFEETLVVSSPWPTDRTVLYWWSGRYWRLKA